MHISQQKIQNSVEHTLTRVTLCLFLSFLFCFIGCRSDPQLDARKELTSIGFEFSKEGFVNAVLREDLRAAELFLAAGMDPNTEADIMPYFKTQGIVAQEQKPFLMPVLLIAQQKNNEQLVKLLIDAGALRAKVELAKRKLTDQLKKDPIKSAQPSDAEGDGDAKAFVERLRKKFERGEERTDEQLRRLNKTLENLK